jgi:hypothetical protein
MWISVNSATEKQELATSLEKVDRKFLKTISPLKRGDRR